MESDQHQMSRSKRGDMIASTKVGFIKRGKLSTKNANFVKVKYW